MSSKREQILAAIKTNLTGTTGVGTRIYRSRVAALTRAESPALVLEPITDTPNINNSTYLKIDWTLRVRVVVVVRGEIPENIADPTIESLHTKILTNTTLGGLAIDIQPSTQSFEVLDADQPAGIITCEYEIQYRTEYNKLNT
tara:strand:+ start:260 stop:688 length:429 start_codon:yes stop_codon:yes gene_type:complete